MFGAIYGRRVKDDYGTHTNSMVLALAPSGSGKEHPRKCVKDILFACGLDNINGSERIGSHAGLISQVDQHPVKLFQIDEIGRMMATMKDARMSHLYNIGTVLMQLYSSAGSVWTGDAYADLAKVKTINSPCVCIFGTSVPETFYDGLTVENLSDGLLARMVVFESEGYGRRRKPQIAPVPPELIAECRAWAETEKTQGGNLGSVNPSPILVPKSALADERHEQHCNEVHDGHVNDGPAAASIWARAPEKSAKLALIHAMCTNWREPEITVASVNWGRTVVNYTTRMVVSHTTTRVGKKRYEKDKEWLWARIDTGMTRNQLSRKTQGLKRRERDEMVEDLIEAGLLKIVQTPGKGRTSTTFVKIPSST
jgi:hypothetical protein